MRRKIRTPFTAKYREFPELVFGDTINGTTYFDATLYIEHKGNVNIHSPVDFIRKFSFWFENFKIIYEISDNDLIITDEATEHVLIDESLALLFIAYIDPSFGAYMIDRVSEMFLNGFVLSDSNILQIIRNRLTNETLSNLIKEK